MCTNDVDEKKAPLMILEYMTHGDLLSFLQAHKYGIETFVCMHAPTQWHAIICLQRVAGPAIYILYGRAKFI